MLIGAEAVLTKKDGFVIKERIKKGYRLSALDEKLRKSRTRKEASLLREARRAGVDTPEIVEEGGFSIKMKHIEGERVKDALSEINCPDICKKIGEAAGKLHSSNIIHGDLTTSNMIVKGDKLYLIDFGLGFSSSKAEDKAMDLHLLREALESTHFSIAEKAWQEILKNYAYGEADKVIKTLSKIEKRGRYRER